MLTRFQDIHRYLPKNIHTHAHLLMSYKENAS